MAEFYRYRNMDKLLGKCFQELERQTIYFASPGEQNDPMEGFRDVVWDGDHIVWTNLLKHYVHCLFGACIVAPIFGDELRLEARHIPISQRWDQMPTPNAAELFNTIWNRAHAECELSDLASRITSMEFAGVRHKVRSDELRLYLVSIHFPLLSIIQEVFVDKCLWSKGQRLVPESSRSNLLTRNGFFDLMPQIPEINEASSQALMSGIEHLLRSIPLRRNFVPRDAGQSNAKFLIFDFHRIYVERLSELLWPEWYTACFVREYHNSSMWANYGDAHKGACLIFEAIEREGSDSLALKTLAGSSWHRGGDVPEHWEFALRSFLEVNYKTKLDEVDFFRSIGMPTTDALIKLWYTDEQDNISDCASQVFGPDGDIETWQNNYWSNLDRDVCSKTKDWEYEQEYRLVLHGLLDPSLDKRRRTLTYDFNSLKGIIFGMRTSDEDKLRVIEVIRGKCEENDRMEFRFLQAYYSPETGDIRSHRLPIDLATERV